MDDKEYLPQDFFSGDLPPEESPRVIIAPHRYIQGSGVIDNLGQYISILDRRNPGLLITSGGMERIGERILESLNRRGIEPAIHYFEGECSDQEVERLMGQYRGKTIDSLIAIGGGKCLDTGKCVAHCMSVPVIICPTVASTDAPCSAVSVMYTLDGVFDRAWFFPESPALVIVDTDVIIRAPLRFFVAGMGDAMATYYEARVCFGNSKARTMVGARPTAIALAAAELGARLLFENGVKAVESAKKKEVNDAVENVIEANTLLSGIGFESGGLAASHGVAQVFPIIPALHEKYMHGEMVALGLLVHLCLEEEMEEAIRVASFFAQVGLPVHLGQLSMDPDRNAGELDRIIDEAMNVFFIHHEPFEITPRKIMQAFKEAHALGMKVAKEIGDEAYKTLHT